MTDVLLVVMFLIAMVATMIPRGGRLVLTLVPVIYGVFGYMHVGRFTPWCVYVPMVLMVVLQVAYQPPPKWAYEVS